MDGRNTTKRTQFCVQEMERTFSKILLLAKSQPPYVTPLDDLPGQLRLLIGTRSEAITLSRKWLPKCPCVEVGFSLAGTPSLTVVVM